MLKMHFLKTNNFYQRCVTALVCFPIFSYSFVYMPFVFCALMISVLIVILVCEWPVLCPYSSSYFFAKTILYPIIPFTTLIFLYLFFRFDLALIWGYVCCFDTMCYLIGNVCGKTPITNISPKKTWEGLIGGTLISESIFFMVHRYIHVQVPEYHFLFYFSISIAAFVGDLFESWLKRNAQIKSSGTMLPGHGGLLDRFDSILFVVMGYVLYKLFARIIIF